MRQFTADRDTTLREFTDSVYPQGSFAFSRLLRDRDIRVNGRKTGRDVSVAAGDVIVYYTTAREEAKPFFTELYSGEQLFVADKDSGVSSEALARALKDLCGARAVHRLDRNTRGVCVFARTEEAEAALKNEFRTRAVRKEYEAVCLHPFAKPSDTLRGYLAKDAAAGRVRIFPAERSGTVPVSLEYSVRETRGELVRTDILLHSGRTHQIRAQMAFAGHPVLGDEKYGDSERNAHYGVRRQVLVAKRISFSSACPLREAAGKCFESRHSADWPQETVLSAFSE